MIFSIVGFACLGHLLVDFIDTMDERGWLPQKPFKCDMCMTFWVSLWPLIHIYQSEGILAAACASILADFIFRLKQRI